MRTLKLKLSVVAAMVACTAVANAAVIIPAPAAAQVQVATTGIIVQDQVALRSAPRDSAQQQAVLWQGDAVEIRGERMDYVQVWDYRRERGGYVRASQLRRVGTGPADAAEILSVVRFLRDTPGMEALGIGYTAAYLQAAPAVVLNTEAGAEAFDALGGFADRLARRASSGTQLNKATETTIAAHIEVATHYGIRFNSLERDGRVQLCYEGEAMRRVMALPAKPEQRARAALVLTRPACISPDLRIADSVRLDEWRADVLDRVELDGLPQNLKNRVQMRRASVWSGLAYQYARRDGVDNVASKAAMMAAQRSIAELTGVNKNELSDDDQSLYADVAMRVSASRWAADTNVLEQNSKSAVPVVTTVAGEVGQTCVLLTDAKHDAKNPLAKRCTYGIVWPSSLSRSRDGNAFSLAVQNTGTWRELWVMKKDANGWSFNVLPPAALNPDTGYIEFAGWVPGGKQMLVAREARSEGKYKRAFEVLRMDTLTAERQASDASILGAFQRWQEPNWKRQTLSLR